MRFPVVSVLVAVLAGATPAVPGGAGDEPDHAAAIAATRELAEEIVGEGLLPGLSVALVAGDRVVWSAGFGHADPERGVPASGTTVYRVGSISKLFTALALMQLVEKGAVDIDRPLADYLPDLGLVNPFHDQAGPVVVRQLTSHCSGLPRESPRGSYFDGSGAGAADAMASLRGVRLVHPPGGVEKYSNIAVSLLGSLIERVTGKPYAEHVEASLLRPLGMRSSSFALGEAIRPALAKGYMQGKDRRLFAAPLFELGTPAAGNLYSTVEDLACLARLIHGGGELAGHRVIGTNTLERMAVRQFPGAGGRFGIGFVVGERFGEKSLEHGGAVYGFSSLFISLPGPRLSVIVLTNADVAFGPLYRLADRLLGGALARARGGADAPEPGGGATGIELPSGTHVFRGPASRIELAGGGLHPLLVWNGYPVRLVAVGPDAFITRDRLMDGNRIGLERDAGGGIAAVEVDGRRFLAFDPSSAPPAPASWERFTGDYGPSYLPVRISLRDGRLVAECETFEYEPAPLEDGSFRFPRGTMYEDEVLRFEGDGPRAAALTLGTMRFQRR
jgi:serine beta-lactamase-like protein LACTB